MQIFPQQNFTVVRQIADHTDVSTYYVRAVVRNAFTDAIIATLDLTDKGGQRFKKDWHVPADPSGQGLWISIVTSVYTDSGYTTKSSLYGDEENTHVILKRQNTGGGGGGGGVSLSDIRYILKEEFGSIPKPTEKWDEVLKAIEDLKESVSEIPTEKMDHTPFIEGLKDIKEKIKNIPKFDSSSIVEQIEGVKEEISKIETPRLTREDVKILERFTTSFPSSLVRTLRKVIKETNFVTSFVTSAHQFKNNKQEPEEDIVEEDEEEVKTRIINLKDLSK